MRHLCTILLATLFLIFSQPLSGQNGEAAREAFRQSYALEGSGEYQASIEALLKVHTPDDYPSHLRLGWLYYLKGNHYQSKTHYAEAMRLMPYAIEAKFGYVLPLAALGNWDEVIRTYEEILKIDPKNSVAHYRLGAIYYERKDYEEAFRHSEIVTNLYPFDYDAVVLFAWVHLQMGNQSKAKALFQRALLIRPDGELALEGLKLLE